VYVCICHAVTEDVVRAHIAAGARDEEAVGRSCRAGTGCGSCLPRICALLREVDPAHGQVTLDLAV